MSDIARNMGKAQRRKRRPNEFTSTKRQRFVDALALTCNVKASAAAAGVDQSTVYYHRIRDAAFAAQWREALDMGCDRLEALLLEHGGAGAALLPPDPDRAARDAVPPFDFEKALKALQYYRSKRPLREPQHNGRAVDRAAAHAAFDKALTLAERRVARERPARD